MTALGIVDLFGLGLGLWALWVLVAREDRTGSTGMLAGALWSVSFPVFWYATIGYVDPVLVGLLAVGVLALDRNRDGAFVATFLTACLVKETAVLLVPVLLGHDLAVRRLPSRRALMRTALALSTWLLIVAGLRVLSPSSPSWGWSPDPDLILHNATRLRTWGGVLLTAGLPTLLVLRRARRLGLVREEIPLWSGCAAAAALSAYAFFVASLDGRFPWTAYPFAIPLAAREARELLSRSNQGSGGATPSPTGASRSAPNCSDREGSKDCLW